MKSAMRAAGKSGARIAVIRGENEINTKSLVVKNMTDGLQSEIPEQSAVEYLKKFF
jgi:histidyl-tRNA synthetase